MTPIYDYLEQIYYDAAGLLDEIPQPQSTAARDYKTIGDYKVADYKEQPHTYADEQKD